MGNSDTMDDYEVDASDGFILKFRLSEILLVYVLYL